MANTSQQLMLQLDRGCTPISARITFASGVPTLQAWSFSSGAWVAATAGFMGVTSVAQTAGAATGDYTLTFQNRWLRYYSVVATFETAVEGTLAACDGVQVITAGTSLNVAGGGTLEFVTALAGVAANPNNADILNLTIWVSDSSSF